MPIEDGTWGFVYCGFEGVGIGVVDVKNGRFRGRDIANGIYEGTITEGANGQWRLDFDMHQPPGAILVQGTSPSPFAMTRSHRSVEVPAQMDE
ncbi:MAG TPA: hypothetical protein VLX09_07375 [Stellaceae bacterium]|nr:hypothetical protein [Stellaceae bacterium]